MAGTERSDPCDSKLDELICDMFDTLNKIFSLRELLNQSLNQGYFHLAKARYSMGIQNVTSLQYNLTESYKAGFKIKVDDIGLSGTFESLCLEDVSSSETDVRSHVRHSKGNVKKQEVSCAVRSDPLTWFGVLVPKALRLSQQNFRSSLDIICQLSQLQLRLIQIKENYKIALNKQIS